MTTRRSLIAAVAAFSLTLYGATAFSADPAPSGTVTVDVIEVALLVGGATGKGKLIFQGKTYDFSITEAKVGGAGVENAHVTGEVYGLNDIADFPGVYVAVDSGKVIVTGKKGINVANDKDVQLHLHADVDGAALELLSAGGLVVSMD